MRNEKTILYHKFKDQYYHFYWDRNMCKYIYRSNGPESNEIFLKRVASILEHCQLSDVELNKLGHKYKPICTLMNEDSK